MLDRFRFTDCPCAHCNAARQTRTITMERGRSYLRVSGNSSRKTRRLLAVAEVVRLRGVASTPEFSRIRLQRIPGHPQLLPYLARSYGRQTVAE
jgi:hypothetical protein